ncbi:hypothetical protein Alg215_11492 [Pyrenophora tritici-repentis]|nr:hypothetical protein Alg215_11492 [Pyrenophora tritici-repentis]
MARYRKSTTEGIQAFRHTVLFAIEYAVRADLGNDAGLQYKLLVALDTAASEVANQLALRHPGSQEKFQHWSASRLGFEDNICFLHLAAQLQLIDFVKHHIDKANYSVSRNESGYNFILATLDYSLFAKHQDPQILTIIPKSPSVDLVNGALKAHGNIPGAFSSWETHLRGQDRDKPRRIEMSIVYLNSGADFLSVLDDSVQYPDKVVSLAKAAQKAV